jgi:hypothetical protein
VGNDQRHIIGVPFVGMALGGGREFDFTWFKLNFQSAVDCIVGHLAWENVE